MTSHLPDPSWSGGREAKLVLGRDWGGGGFTLSLGAHPSLEPKRRSSSRTQLTAVKDAIRYTQGTHKVIHLSGGEGVGKEGGLHGEGLPAELGQSQVCLGVCVCLFVCFDGAGLEPRSGTHVRSALL